MTFSPSDPPHLHAFVSRGPRKGTILYPHKHRDGRYVVSMTRFEKDYIYVDKAADLLDWLEKGYRLRMSTKVGGVPSPSLIEPGAVFRPVLL